MQKRGKLYVIYGPMFAGKSTELLRYKRRAEVAGKCTIVFKPRLDNRYSTEEVVTHDGVRANSIVVVDSQDLLITATQVFPEVTDVFIDEVQFFDNRLTDAVRSLVNLGINVYAAGLNTDFRGEPFPVLADLLVRADYVTRLYAVCKKCGSYEATMTQRLVDGKPAKPTDPLIVVGGDETYEARCADCYEVGVAESE